MNDQRIRTGAILTAALMLFGLAGCGNFRERANQQDEVSAETRSESSYLLQYKLNLVHCRNAGQCALTV